jgi:threonine dehydratase
MGLEIIEQVPEVDAVIIPVGGGGLIAGAALAIKNLKPSVQIIVSVTRKLRLIHIQHYFIYYNIPTVIML